MLPYASPKWRHIVDGTDHLLWRSHGPEAKRPLRTNADMRVEGCDPRLIWSYPKSGSISRVVTRVP